MRILAGKKILVVGGSGYVGGYVARTLAQLGAQVSSLARHGPKHDHPINRDINWLIGSVMTDCSKFSSQINEADLILHTVGTLIDTTVTARKQPGEPGTYEQMNRDALLRLLQNVKKPTKIVYLSADGCPPYLPRYLSTKLEAEEALLQSPNQGYVLRPGFIYSWKHRKWSLPIKYGIDAWNMVHPTISNWVSDRPILSKVAKEFTVAPGTKLTDIGNTVGYLALHKHEAHILHNPQIAELSRRFTDQQCGFQK